MFSTCKRSHTIVSHTLCELNALQRDDFAEIALDYPILLKNAWTVLFVFVLRISYWGFSTLHQNQISFQYEIVL
jgi:hypothetical protein